MPVYTYRCENCGIQFDQAQKFSDPMLTKCPECGKKSLRKVYTPVGIVFKGKGFYATDNRSPSGMGYSKSNGDATSSTPEPKKATESAAPTSGTANSSSAA